MPAFTVQTLLAVLWTFAFHYYFFLFFFFFFFFQSYMLKMQRHLPLVGRPFRNSWCNWLWGKREEHQPFRNVVKIYYLSLDVAFDLNFIHSIYCLQYFLKAVDVKATSRSRGQFHFIQNYYRQPYCCIL